MVYKPCFNNGHSCILLLLFLQLPLAFYAQSKSTIANWKIAVRTAGATAGYDIHIEQYRNKTNFFFKSIDSLRQRDMENDAAYIKQRNAIRAAATVDEATYEIEKLATIIEQFEVSRKDTLYYSADLPDISLQSLLDSLASLPVEILSNNTGLKNEAPVSTGYSFHFMRYNGKKKTADFFTSQPAPNRYPLLYRLLTQTIGFYKKEKKEAIITTDFTRAH